MYGLLGIQYGYTVAALLVHADQVLYCVMFLLHIYYSCLVLVRSQHNMDMVRSTGRT